MICIHNGNQSTKLARIYIVPSWDNQRLNAQFRSWEEPKPIQTCIHAGRGSLIYILELQLALIG